MFVQTLRNLRNLDAGFQVEHVAMASVQTPAGMGDGQRVAIFSELRNRVAHLPGVTAVGYSHVQQLSGFSIEERAWPQGGAPDPKQGYTEEERVSPGFFDAMATPLLRGRDFTESDGGPDGKVAVVNETFAHLVFPGRNPVGLRFNSDASPKDPIEIVGLAKDAKWINLRQAAPPTYYVPYAQIPSSYVTLAVRTNGNVQALAAALPGVARAVDSRLKASDAATFAEIEDRTLVVERQVADVSSAFGVLALCIACVGIYGILAYGVARRTREIGVRMALGASRRAMHWMVVRESLALVGVGFAIGAPLALAASQFVRSLLFGVAAFDAGTLVAALVILAATTLIAAYVPARRAASVDPMDALRHG
jgi:predicted permease